jgi:hypothetical protein
MTTVSRSSFVSAVLGLVSPGATVPLQANFTFRDCVTAYEDRLPDPDLIGSQQLDTHRVSCARGHGMAPGSVSSSGYPVARPTFEFHNKLLYIRFSSRRSRANKRWFAPGYSAQGHRDTPSRHSIPTYTPALLCGGLPASCFRVPLPIGLTPRQLYCIQLLSIARAPPQESTRALTLVSILKQS